MIDEAAAHKTVESFLTEASSNRSWHLEEFAQGWMVQYAPAATSSRGDATLVVEKETGRLVSFSSGVPPTRIRDNYPGVRYRGHNRTPEED